MRTRTFSSSSIASFPAASFCRGQNGPDRNGAAPVRIRPAAANHPSATNPINQPYDYETHIASFADHRRSLVCVSLFAQKFPNYPIPQQPDTLRILGIGNSFTDDGMMYLPELLEAAGIRNVVLGRLYIAGCSLERHCREYAGNAPA